MVPRGTRDYTRSGSRAAWVAARTKIRAPKAKSEGAGEDGRHLRELHHRHQDAEHEDVHHPPGSQVADVPEQRGQPGRQAQRNEDRQEQGQLQTGGQDTGEGDRRGDLPLSLAVEIQDAGKERRLRVT